MLNFFKKKSPYDKTVAYINKHFSKKVATILLNNIRPCFELDNTVEKELTIGCSKQAGFPDLPPNFNWPESNGQQLDFVLQLNLEDFESTKIGLPEKGLLYFFIDLTDENEFPTKKGQFKLIYSDQMEGLTKTPYAKINELEEKALTVIEMITIPNTDSYLLMDVELADEEFDHLLELTLQKVSEFYGSNGVYDVNKLVNDQVIDEWVENYNTTKGTSLEPEKATHDFVQLLSFMLDEWHYPDSELHFGIHKNDLKHLKFDQTIIAFVSS